MDVSFQTYVCLIWNNHRDQEITWHHQQEGFEGGKVEYCGINGERGLMECLSPVPSIYL